MEKARLAWFAGVMEAEGSFSAQVYTMPNGRVRITPFICIVNSDRAILEECQEVMAILATEEKSPPRWCAHSGTNRPCWTVRLDGESIRPVLKAMLPFMRGDKRHNAQVLLNYMESRKGMILRRDVLGRICRQGYTREQVEMICSLRTHKNAKSLEAILEAPNIAA